MVNTNSFRKLKRRGVSALLLVIKRVLRCCSNPYGLLGLAAVSLHSTEVVPCARACVSPFIRAYACIGFCGIENLSTPLAGLVFQRAIDCMQMASAAEDMAGPVALQGEPHLAIINPDKITRSIGARGIDISHVSNLAQILWQYGGFNIQFPCKVLPNDEEDGTFTLVDGSHRLEATKHLLVEGFHREKTDVLPVIIAKRMSTTDTNQLEALITADAMRSNENANAVFPL